MYIRTDIVEPKTITFNIVAVMNGNQHGSVHTTNILTTVEIRGCPNERQIVTIPGLPGNWDSHQQDIKPTRGDLTFRIPEPSHFVYSNRYCPFVKYHIYQDYPTLLEKVRGEYACGNVASETKLDSL
jgi:hypothetical protein